MTTNRLVIVEDLDIVRQGIVALIDGMPALSVVGQAADGEEALRVVEDCTPDIVLMDLAMPRMDGIEATAKIKQRWPQIKVLALTVFNQENLLYDVLKAGADGYLLKDVNPDEIRLALQTVKGGNKYFCPAISDHVVRGYIDGHKNMDGEELDPLSNREREVLKLLAQGRSHKEIGNELFISPKTVESHRSNLLRKLAVESTADLIVIAARAGLV